MRLRNVPGAREEIADSLYCCVTPEQHRGQWRAWFGEEDPARPLHVEIGTGKGRFLAEMAGAHPEILYLGLEKYSSVLVKAVRRQQEQALENERFVRMEAEIVTEVFAPGEVDRIYLNFSDPWPKARHAQRRLPSSSFLRRYEQILAPDGTVEFKTDNEALFDFACEEAKSAGWELIALTRDLHADPVMNEGNVLTEYEERFSSLGHPIYKVILRKYII